MGDGLAFVAHVERSCCGSHIYIYIYISFFLIPVQGQLPCFSSVRVERVFGLARTALFIGEGGDGREGVRIV